eukprot:9876025-Ditylum_brightwellii.AAC.1
MDWKSFAIARKQNAQRTQQVVKMANGILPTNKWINRYQHSCTDKCPLCHAEIKMRDHLLCCPSSLSKTWQTELLQDLDKTLQVSHTKPSLARALKQILCQVIGLNHER